MPDHLRSDPLSLDALLEETSGVDAGALVVFGGVVRAQDHGREVAALDYDAHMAMAEDVMARIEGELLEREGVLACRLLHRTGEVPAGDASVYAVVRARHRPEAFQAARDAIDRLKAEVPIWKEDISPDGSRTPRSAGEGTPLRPQRENPSP